MAPQRKFGCLCAAVALLQASAAVAAAAVVPRSAVRAAARCSAAPDAVDCLLRAAAAGVDALARSAEPVDLVPGVVALVKNVVQEADPTPPPPPTPTTTTTTTTQPSADAATAAAPSTSDASAAVTVSGEDALVDSVTAFAKSRAISVRAPARLLDSLKSTLTEGKRTVLRLI